MTDFIELFEQDGALWAFVIDLDSPERHPAFVAFVDRDDDEDGLEQGEVQS